MTSASPESPSGGNVGASRAGASGFGPRSRAVWVVLLAVLFVALAVPVYYVPIHVDVGCEMEWAHCLLDGKRLYEDCAYELNPPLFIFVAVPPLVLARATGLPEIPVFNTFVLALVVAGFLLSWRVLRKTALLVDPVVRGVFLLAVVVSFGVVLHDGLFAQREFLLMVLATPYVILSAARAMARPVPLGLALVVGAVAGVGLALKPFFLLLVIGIEVYLTFVRRAGWFWRRPEVLAVAGVHIVYWASVLVFTPGYFKIARMAVQTYAAYNRSYRRILWALLAIFPTPLPFVLFGVVRPTDAARELRRLLLVALVALMAVVVVQHKGIDYHYYPSHAAALLVVAVTALAAFENLRAGQRVFRFRGAITGAFLAVYLALLAGSWAWNSYQGGGFVHRHMAVAVAGLVLLAAVVAAGTGYLSGTGRSQCPLGPVVLALLMVYLAFLAASWCYNCYCTERPYRDRELVDFVRDHAKGKPIVLLSSSLFPQFPLVNYSGTQWGLRLNCLWTLPAFYVDAGLKSDGTIYRTRQEMGDVERFTVDCVVEDMQRNPPALVIVDVREKGKKQAFGTTDFDYLAYFSRDPRFAKLMKDYQLVRGPDGQPLVYSHCTIYERRALGALLGVLGSGGGGRRTTVDSRGRNP